MLKELVQFTTTVIHDPAFSGLNLTLKEGLHLVLQVKRSPEEVSIANEPVFAGVFTKKTAVEGEFKRCASWAQAAWMIATNKCFDLPSKAFHSASPFCFALKRSSLADLTDPAEWHRRISTYFTKAGALLEDDEEKKVAEAFRLALNDRNRFDHWLAGVEDYQKVKEGEYIVLYLDLPLETYVAANRKYLKENLFNTGAYNQPDPDQPEVLHGTSNWFNGFPTKKPFLMHQSATFDIAGRISSEEAQRLHEFSELSRRKLFPNPLPLFIMADERENLPGHAETVRKKAFKIFKDDVLTGNDKRKGYLETIEELWRDFPDQVGNYYLLMMGIENQKSVVKDFDFVSRFDLNLNSDGSPWEVYDLFGSKESMTLRTVTDLMTQVLPPMFNNALVVRRKEKEWIFHWFDEIDPAYTKTHNAYLLAMKYRKAFYDFIYKSQRQSVTGQAIVEVLLTGIVDDIRLDKWEGKYNSEGLNIRTKLNLLFSLHSYFSSPPNPRFMPENITQLRDSLESMAKGDAQIATDEQFAFAAGQVVARVFYESETADRSYKYLEPFLSQSNADQFRMAIGNFIKRYKHVEFPPRFRNVSADVLTCPVKGDLQKLLPVFLAGVFSKTQLYWEKKEKADPSSTESTITTN